MYKKLNQMSFLLCIINLTISFNFSSYAEASKLKIKWERIPVEIYNGFSWSPDGKKIAFANFDENQLLILNLKDKVVQKSVDLPRHEQLSQIAVEWSPDASYIAVATGSAIHVVDVQRQTIIQTYSPAFLGHEQGSLVDARWITNNLELAIFDSTGYIDILDLANNRVLNSVDLISHNEIVYGAFDWNETTQLFAAPLYISAIGFWDSNGKIATNLVTFNKEMKNVPQSECKTDDSLTSGANRDLTYMNWDNQGFRLAIAVGYHVVVCTFNHELTTIQTQKILTDQPAKLVSWSPDNRWLLVAYDGPNACGISVYDSRQNYQLSQIIGDNICVIGSMRWSTDGNYLALNDYKSIWLGSLDKNENN